VPDVDTTSFHRDGYVALPGWFDRPTVDALRGHIENVADQRRATSGLDDGAMTFLSLLYPLSDALQTFVSDQHLLDAVCPLLGPDVWVRWDQAVVKAPGAPAFPWHQDNGYSLLRDAYLQAWIALTDAGPDDGGLWVAPGTHRRPRSHHHVGGQVEVDEAPSEAVALSARAGDLVLFSSRLLHTTTPNTSARERWVYVVEFMDRRDHDPFVEPPYLTVARHGRSAPSWSTWPPGRRSLRNQLRYLPDRLAVRRSEGRWRRGI